MSRAAAARSGRGGAAACLVEGTLPFVRGVPWRLHLPRGRGGPVPLLVALHGKGDRAERFEAEARGALPRGWALLVPSAPIPRDRNGPRDRLVGDAWYLYDGDTPLFRESLGRAEAHLLGLLARLGSEDPPPGFRAPDLSRAALLGFSQGGYLAGVTAVRNPGVFRGLVIVGGRLKDEMLGSAFPAAREAGLRILGLHGSGDRAVPPGPSERSLGAARAAGLDASFRTLPGAHEFTPAMGTAARRWLAGLRQGNREGAPPVRGAPPPSRDGD